MSKVILYVDDSEDDLILFRAACKLAHARCQLVLLNSGQQAMHYLDRCGPYTDRAQFPDPNLVLLDVKMPGVDGFAVLRHLRSEPARAAWPVGLFTSSDWPGDIENARQLGATWYFRKPPDMNSLVDLVLCVLCGGLVRAKNVSDKSRLKGDPILAEGNALGGLRQKTTRPERASQAACVGPSNGALWDALSGRTPFVPSFRGRCPRQLWGGLSGRDRISTSSHCSSRQSKIENLPATIPVVAP